MKVHFDLRGREWQGKYFTNLNAWKVEGESAMRNTSPNNESFNQDAAPVNNVNNNVDAREDLEDLPF